MNITQESEELELFNAEELLNKLKEKESVENSDPIVDKKEEPYIFARNYNDL